MRGKGKKVMEENNGGNLEAGSNYERCCFRVYDPLFAENKAKKGDLSSKPVRWLQDTSSSKSWSLSRLGGNQVD